ncbi:MAG: HlyD family efflux transporter periplasmic adaptor subunit [Planctomycetota bacterium]
MHQGDESSTDRSDGIDAGERPRAAASAATRPSRPQGAWLIVSRAVRLGVGVVALLVAIGLVVVANMARPEPERKSVVEQAPLVRTVAVAVREAPRVWTGYGTARAMTSAEVSAQVSARVVERPAEIEDGARVNAGDLLARLEPIDFEQRLEAAKQLAAATQAELDGLGFERERLRERIELVEQELAIETADLSRYVDALERGAGNRAEAERRQNVVNRVSRERSSLLQQIEVWPTRQASAQARLLQLNADIRLREEELARTKIRSPISGYVQSIGVEVGELLAVGAPVARVVDLSLIEIPLRLPVSASGALAVGDRVDVMADGPMDGSPGNRGEGWTGVVERIAPESDAATRTLTVFALVRQDPSARAGRLLPGRFVTARVESSESAPRLIAPRRAVDGDRVLVAADGAEGDGLGRRASSRRVVVSHQIEARFPEIDPDETQWAVFESADLEAGQRVIVSNLDQLNDGSLVRIESPALAGERENAEAEAQAKTGPVGRGG